MGFLRNFVKAGVAKKLLDLVRDPRNQARARSAFDKYRNKRRTRP